MRGNAKIKPDTMPDVLHDAVPKTALAQMRHSVSNEFGPDGRRANAIAPVLIETLFFKVQKIEPPSVGDGDLIQQIGGTTQCFAERSQPFLTSMRPNLPSLSWAAPLRLR
ncbi:MAG: hypothetical protein ACRBB0_23215 [Pelagimonas sp.]|uniref:hypothetical protein n=1 Tax=Pelagimonas sp. TaxID=2073170 RepID=UPI003D6A3838